MIAWVFVALGLVMIVEGLAYALAPLLVERALELLRRLPVSMRRQFGLLVAVSGLICLWFAFFLGL